VRESLDEGKVVIVAGFQGVDPATKEITTIGRGGSDATAVALAAAWRRRLRDLHRRRWRVHRRPPHLVATPQTRRDQLRGDAGIVGVGAGVLMSRSVEFGRRFGVPIHVRSSFNDHPGTWVKETTMEQAIISGIAHDTSEAKVTVRGLPDRPGSPPGCSSRWRQQGINVDMIVQNVAQDGTTDISFTVGKATIDAARAIAEQTAVDVGAARSRSTPGSARSRWWAPV
jgi:aspartate kinase